ncbi:MAG: hypothetical protein CM15mP58_18450 [Burkholderiaceae bacterium]|nr:MAG: hypothetical protein CM15mP58_18450 [Burkholderiaceae bacterium]
MTGHCNNHANPQDFGDSKRGETPFELIELISSEIINKAKETQHVSRAVSIFQPTIISIPLSGNKHLLLVNTSTILRTKNNWKKIGFFVFRITFAAPRSEFGI